MRISSETQHKNEGLSINSPNFAPMVRNIQLRVSLKEEGKVGLKGKTAKYLGVAEKEIQIKVLRKSIDARKPNIYFNYKLEVYINEPMPSEKEYNFDYNDVSKAKPVHIGMLTSIQNFCFRIPKILIISF